MEEWSSEYRMIRSLGRGGMCEAYLAERDLPDGTVERVCLKRTIPYPDAEHDILHFFQSEALLVSTLHHPNIVALQGWGEAGWAEWWMALEYVEGTNLRDLLTALRGRDERLPIDVAAYVAVEVAKALAYAHAQRREDGTSANIIHRDVTPSNVLLRRDGAVKLTDFGIAKSPYSRETRSGFKKGKAPYMAPEWVLGDPFDHRLDLFALGVVLFEMLAGARPFGGKTDIAVHASVISNRRKDIREAAPHAPTELADIVDLLLASDPAERLASAAALIERLGAFASDGAPPALSELVRSSAPD